MFDNALTNLKGGGSLKDLSALRVSILMKDFVFDCSNPKLISIIFKIIVFSLMYSLSRRIRECLS